MIKLAFLGSKAIGYDCLKILLARTDVEVVCVLSNDNARFDSSKSVVQLATAHKVPVLAGLELLPENLDILLSVQYHQILKAQDIAKAKLALNLHMAPLPEYRGSNQFSFAIIDGKKEFGTTIHKMDTRIDHGDIVCEKRFEIPPNCWISELYELTNKASLELFEENIDAILTGNINFTSQASLEEARGTSLHFRSEIADLKKIDLSWPQDKIERHIRATSMPGFDPPFFYIGDKQINCVVQQNG